MALSEIGEWPTHQRFRDAGAGKVIFNTEQFKEAIKDYLKNPAGGTESSRKFIQDEVTLQMALLASGPGNFWSPW